MQAKKNNKKQHKLKSSSTVTGDNICVLRPQLGESERTNIQENKVVYLKKT